MRRHCSQWPLMQRESHLCVHARTSISALLCPWYANIFITFRGDLVLSLFKRQIVIKWRCCFFIIPLTRLIEPIVNQYVVHIFQYLEPIMGLHIFDCLVLQRSPSRPSGFTRSSPGCSITRFFEVIILLRWRYLKCCVCIVTWSGFIVWFLSVSTVAFWDIFRVIALT